MKRNPAILTLIFLFFLGIMFPELAAQDFGKIDEHARNAPEAVNAKLGDLISYLVEPAQNDTEKARAFYTWIADNIRCDVVAYKNRKKEDAPDQDNLPRTLKRRKAVCEGYSNLFQAMCDTVGISCYTIAGWSKKEKSGGKFTVAKTSHTWNIIKLDGEWKTIDVTWAAGGVGDKVDRKGKVIKKGLFFNKRFNPEWFLMPPRNFSNTHLPYDPMMQLLDCPISFETFKKEKITQEPIDPDNSCGGDFQARFARWEKLEPFDREVRTLENAHEFEPLFKHYNQIAFLYKGKAEALTEEIKKTSDVDQIRDLYRKTLNYYKKALKYSREPELMEALELEVEHYKKLVKGF